MPRYERTTLWSATLAPQPEPDPDATERSRLRHAFERFRERAGVLAGEIPQDLRDFTVHDLTHIDALWEAASLIAGPAFPLTPAEAFVLGGAFLVHDLGLSLAAYAGGMQEVRKHQLWKDTLASLAREDGNTAVASGGRFPTTEHERLATAAALRQLHAERAEGLALTTWTDRGGGRHMLLEDGDLRNAYGRVIGLVAHSHWWGVDQLVARLPPTLGAPGVLPNDWTVDAVKLAVLLRCADAAHLDDRRAPAFLRAVRGPAEDSDAHWAFQGRLNQPRLEEGRLVYTAKQAFPPEDARAWWLCYDTLRGVDRELSHADSLLADTRRPRIAARAVGNVEDPRRLAGAIPTAGWEPIDARVRVGAVTELVTALGGRELYGADPVVPLRELIQNGADAVRARRLMEDRPASWGAVDVALESKGDACWVEVSDTGVGMSLAVLSGPFLDFGASLWRSDRLHNEFPGLAAKGFEPTGRFGIGFFSVFTWGSTVQVRTRRFEAAQHDTWVLEFTRGLSGRPLLRRAEPHEYLREGGTTVRVQLDGPSLIRDLIEGRPSHRGTFEQECARLCATADVNVRVKRGVEPAVTVVEANDWLTMDGLALLERVRGRIGRHERQQMARARNAIRLRVIKDDAGRPIGRACLVVPFDGMGHASGAVCVGGFAACAMSGIAGVLLGRPTTATRQEAIPLLRGSALAAFASEQVRAIAIGAEHPPMLLHVAKVAWHLGGDIGALPVAWTLDGLMNRAELEAWLARRNSVVLASDTPFQQAAGIGAGIVLGDDVVVVSRGYSHVLHASGAGSIEIEDEWLGAPHLRPDLPQPESIVHHEPLLAEVLGCITRAWGGGSAALLAPQLGETSIQVGTVHGTAATSQGYRLVRAPSGSKVV